MVDRPHRGGWHLTGGTVRATSLAVIAGLTGVVLGRPDLVVLATPFGLLSVLALAHAPRDEVTGRVHLQDRWLHEGQSTSLRVHVHAEDALDQVTVTLAKAPHVLTSPPGGVLVTTPVPGQPECTVRFQVSPRRWGRRASGRPMVAATSSWGGFRWGPQQLSEPTLVALPQPWAFDATEAPNPVGLIGQNRARRPGAGTEFHSIRPFQPGDRLRRVNWRTTLRTGRLHAVGTSSQQDSAIMIVLDAVTDVGRSDGIDGAASTLDVGVRAASALAAHHLGVGDRVSLRVLGRTAQVLGPGVGERHRRRLQEVLAQVRPGWPDLLTSRRLRVPASPGTIVVVLSPLLTEEMTTVVVSLAHRGLDVVCVDTLAEGVLPEQADDPGSAARLAWRMRLVEREMQLTEVRRRGIPVVPWRGPGTLDEALRRLSRRSRLPRAVSR